MIDVVPEPLTIFIRPLSTGQIAQVDVINTNTVAVASARFTFNTNTDGRDLLMREPCTTPTFDCTAAFPIDFERSRPATVVCPSTLGLGESSTRTLTVEATFVGGATAMDTVDITCTAESESIKIFTTQRVFPTTQTGTTTDRTITITSEFPGPTGVPIEFMDLSDPTTFEITSCLGSTCRTHSANSVDVGIACHPQTPGPHVATLTVKGSGATTQTTLTCTAYGPAIDGDGAPITGDGGPDAGNGGGGGGGSVREPDSFYACSSTAIAGALPIVLAIVVATIRRRRCR